MANSIALELQAHPYSNGMKIQDFLETTYLLFFSVNKKWCTNGNSN
jgi:hypothetical protein